VGYENFKINEKLYRSHKFLGIIKNKQIPKINEPDIFEKIIWLPLKQYKDYSCAPNVQEFCKKYIDKKISE